MQTLQHGTLYEFIPPCLSYMCALHTTFCIPPLHNETCVGYDHSCTHYYCTSRARSNVPIKSHTVAISVTHAPLPSRTRHHHALIGPHSPLFFYPLHTHWHVIWVDTISDFIAHCFLVFLLFSTRFYCLVALAVLFCLCPGHGLDTWISTWAFCLFQTSFDPTVFKFPSPSSHSLLLF